MLCCLLQPLGGLIQFIPLVCKLSQPEQSLGAICTLPACPGECCVIEFARLVQCSLLGADLGEQEDGNEFTRLLIGRVEE